MGWTILAVQTICTTFRIVLYLHVLSEAYEIDAIWCTFKSNLVKLYKEVYLENESYIFYEILSMKLSPSRFTYETND